MFIPDEITRARETGVSIWGNTGRTVGVTEQAGGRRKAGIENEKDVTRTEQVIQGRSGQEQECSVVDS